MSPNLGNPNIILLLSGKRKSGKDHIAANLQTILGTKAQVIHISEPIKGYYAKQFNLNLEELLSDNPYKEKFRQDMIVWSDKIRAENPGYFCKLACEKAPCKDIWIVSDIRRKTDIKWFQANYKNTKTIRISANNCVRISRGWAFTLGVDDVASECDLDDWNDWDLEVINNDMESNKDSIDKIINLITLQ